MAKIEYRDTTSQDMIELENNIRKSDIEELRLTFAGQSAGDVIRKSCELSDKDLLFSAFVDGKLACISGCIKHPEQERTGICWNLGTDVLTKYAKRYTLDTKRAIAVMHDRYPLLYNVVDAGNSRTIKWLEMIGFKMTKRINDGKLIIFESRYERA